MKKGPQSKNPANRQRRNAPSQLRVVSGGRLPEPVMPRPDSHSQMLKQTQDSWSEFWASDVGAALVSTDVPSVVRLFRLRDQWERCARAVHVDPLTLGSQGQMVENPLAKRMDRIGGEIRQLEDRFGLNPAARAKLNVSFGDAVRSVDDLSRRFQADDDDRLQIIDAAAVEDS
jgi:P27 family predicted phage terminase small subunit